MSRRAELEQVAGRVFGWQQLRPAQLDAMDAILAGRDVLAVMPTGSGKSAIFQVPAILIDGVTLVISPLIALQQDQITRLAEIGAPAAVAINSRQRAAEADRTWETVLHNDAEYVFLAPEQLTNDGVIERLRSSEVSLVVVDEAHCVSAWGHDFRPSYLRLADAIERLGRPRIAALTATASPVVRREIVEQLRLRDPTVIATGFDRPNLRLEADLFLADADKRDAVSSTVAGLDGPGLLYTATRKDAEFYAAELSARGVKAAAYHAGLRSAERDEVHRGFHDGDYDVVAATSAFGMGIDKPDVRFVVHASVPDALDSYYQQIGRGGRDGGPALARLFYRAQDLSLARMFTTQRPDQALLTQVHEALRGAGRKRLTELSADLDVRGRKLTNAVNLLELAGAITSERTGFSATDADTVTAVRHAVDVADAAERVDRTRVEMMRGYAETRDCRRQFLLGYFGETLAEPCGNCDRCAANAAEGRAPAEPQESALPVDTPVEHTQWGPGAVISGEADRITVLFDNYGYRTLSMKAVRESGVLRVP